MGDGSWHRWWPRIQSWLVVAAAPLSLGLATFAAVGYAAVRMRSWLLGLATLGYFASFMAFVNTNDETITNVTMAVNFLVGPVHLLLVRPSLARALARSHLAAREREARDRLGWELLRDPAYLYTMRCTQRREQVRAMLAGDPALADELLVGRPDLPRTFDDGGLVDLNRVPESVIAGLPGFDHELARRVVAVRESRGGYLAVDDLVVFADVPLDVLAPCRDRLMLSPPPGSRAG